MPSQDRQSCILTGWGQAVQDLSFWGAFACEDIPAYPAGKQRSPMGKPTETQLGALSDGVVCKYPPQLAQAAAGHPLPMPHSPISLYHLQTYARGYLGQPPHPAHPIKGCSQGCCSLSPPATWWLSSPPPGTRQLHATATWYSASPCHLHPRSTAQQRQWWHLGVVAGWERDDTHSQPSFTGVPQSTPKKTSQLWCPGTYWRTCPTIR